MSKAFTRESDDGPEEPLPGRAGFGLPEGAPNYLTPDGAERLRQELERLVEVERPALAASGDGPNRQLRRLDQRIAEIGEILRTATVVPVPARPWDEAGFGAVVMVREADGEEFEYRIVGPAEVDLDLGWLSTLAPVARALMNRRVGEEVTLQVPRGVMTLQIVGVSYPSATV